MTKAVTEQNGRIVNLAQAVAERESQVASLTSSRSWQLKMSQSFIGWLSSGEFL